MKKIIILKNCLKKCPAKLNHSIYYPSEEGILIKYRHPENEDYIFLKKLSVK